MKLTYFRHAATIAAFCAATPASAEPFEDLGALERQLVAVLGADIGQPGGPVAPLDRRLRLARCAEGVAIAPPALGAAALRCSSLGWRIRVPLVTRAAAVEEGLPGFAVRKGDIVEVVARGAAFTVSTQAIAEQDGRVGARIRVRSGPKSVPMMVEVEREGVVRVPGS